MAQVIWTYKAYQSLRNVLEYISITNPVAAQKLARSVVDSVARLADFPESGRALPELSDFNYREVIVNPLRIIYRADDNKVHLLYVLRQEQNLRRYMLK